MRTSEKQLVIAGGVSAMAYLTIAVVVWLGSVFEIDSGRRILLIPALAILAMFYVRACRVAADCRLPVIVVFAVCFAIIGFLIFPFDSTDVFFYIATGWQQSHYGMNPYRHTLSEIPNVEADPMMSGDWMVFNRNPWQSIPVPYGFLFTALTRVLTALGSGNWWLTLALFSALNFLAFCGTALLLYATAKLLPNANPTYKVFLYTWNPLVLTQFMGDLHNDILMGFFVVLALYCLLSKRGIWALPALVAGGLIKYIAFLLIPFAIVSLLFREGKKTLCLSLLIATIFGAVLAIPYIDDLAHFKYGLIWAQWSESTGSFHAFVATLAVSAVKVIPGFHVWIDPFRFFSRVLLWGAFGVVVIYRFVKDLRPQSNAEVAYSWTILLSTALMLGSSQFFSWYLGTLFPLSVLVQGTFLGQSVIAISVGQLLGFTDLRRKAIGFFLICTLIPLLLVWWSFRRRYRARNPESVANGLQQNTAGT